MDDAPPGIAASFAGGAVARAMLATPQSAPRPVAVTYGEGYRIRARIHKFASFATLPLFGAEAVVGQMLYTNPTEGKKSLHLAIATGMGGLLAVNSVTGGWNLIEARKDPHGRWRRLIHGVMLLGADAGFFGAALTAPGDDAGERRAASGRAESEGGSRSTHRAFAMTSIGLTIGGYLVMLFGK